MDTFIERSHALLAARPETTRVSIRYTHRKVAHDKDATVGGKRPAVVVVKTFDPLTGTLFKIRITKANELSRVLSSLGPRSVEVTSKSLLGSEGPRVRKRGLASLMSDAEFPDEVIESTTALSQKAVEGAGAKKDSKKKKPKKK